LIDLETFETLGGHLNISAPAKGYRGGIDPYLLAACADGAGKILDMGTGMGTVILALATRLRKEGELESCQFEGLDICPINVKIASDNAKQNELDINFFQANILGYRELEQNQYDEILINPPYFEDGHYYEDDETRKQLSNHEGQSGALLKDWIIAANYLLKAKGALTMIHRTDRLDDILSFLKEKKFGAIELFPIWPRQNEASKLILLKARKNRNTGLKLHQGLILHQDHGAKEYTDEAKEILYNCGSICL
tara:strand:+ start:1046 stop:1801 length:756 start_codon:yes stop_codon:yes gene_type:complete